MFENNRNRGSLAVLVCIIVPHLLSVEVLVLRFADKRVVDQRRSVLTVVVIDVVDIRRLMNGMLIVTVIIFIGFVPVVLGADVGLDDPVIVPVALHVVLRE